MRKFKPLFLVSLFIAFGLISYSQCYPGSDSLLVYCVNPKKQNLKFYWKDEANQPYRSFDNLKTSLNRKGLKLLFAMNGGMYKTDNSPLGLFIDSGKIITPLNKASASGNFYLKPNGVFYISKDNTTTICATEKFKFTPAIKYATQSGPMLVIDGKLHPEFKKGSSNLNIRNGVGILPNGQLLFVMSKKPINLFDFADFFLKAGCKNALYLDGFVSQTYLPAQNWQQTGGNFGVIIAETSYPK